MLSEVLSNLDNAITVEALFRGIRGRKYVITVGCALGASEEALHLRSMERSNSLIVAADGATKILLDLGIIPDLVVTDLDGEWSALLEASSRGSVLVVHAHGDNIDRIRRVKEFRGPLIGSTQVEPRRLVYNFGGFTDGDRALHILYYAGYRRVYLSGFDLDNPWQCPGKSLASLDIKRLKLHFAKKLISNLERRGMEVRNLGELIGGPGP